MSTFFWFQGLASLVREMSGDVFWISGYLGQSTVIFIGWGLIFGEWFGEPWYSERGAEAITVIGNRC